MTYRALLIAAALALILADTSVTALAAAARPAPREPALLRPGHASAADVLERLGEPEARLADDAGHDLWRYASDAALGTLLGAETGATAPQDRDVYLAFVEGMLVQWWWAPLPPRAPQRR